MRLGVLSYTNTAGGVGCFARDIVDNLPVDSYFSVDWSIVWTAATVETPELRGQIAEML